MLAVTAIAFFRRASSPAVVDVAAPANGDIQDAPVINPGYLGSAACSRCHAERVTEFQATNHFRTFRAPDPARMPPGFADEKDGVFRSSVPGLQFEMTRSGSDFLQTSIRVTSGAKQRHSAHIDFVLGAGGKADEVYLTWHEDQLCELPLVWLFTSGQWGCSHVNAYGTDDFSRASTVRCLECHNTWFRHIPGSLNQYDRESFVAGVTCECCHGPGRSHVEFHEAHPEAASGREITNPAELTRER
jgi:hypothetical protein